MTNDSIPKEKNLHWSDPAGALRSLSSASGIPAGLPPLMIQAADEIERLQREVDALGNFVAMNANLIVSGRADVPRSREPVAWLLPANDENDEDAVTLDHSVVRRANRRGIKEVPLYERLSQPPDEARALSEWHEDIGDVVWWKFPIDEPAYIGSPLASDWPGYHTHWTPHPPIPGVAVTKPAVLVKNGYCTDCGGINDHYDHCLTKTSAREKSAAIPCVWRTGCKDENRCKSAGHCCAQQMCDEMDAASATHETNAPRSNCRCGTCSDADLGPDPDPLF